MTEPFEVAECFTYSLTYLLLLFWYVGTESDCLYLWMFRVLLRLLADKGCFELLSFVPVITNSFALERSMHGNHTSFEDAKIYYYRKKQSFVPQKLHLFFEVRKKLRVGKACTLDQVWMRQNTYIYAIIKNYNLFLCIWLIFKFVCNFYLFFEVRKKTWGVGVIWTVRFQRLKIHRDILLSIKVHFLCVSFILTLRHFFSKICD